jgi:hypothetical protein
VASALYVEPPDTFTPARPARPESPEEESMDESDPPDDDDVSFMSMCAAGVYRLGMYDFSGGSFIEMTAYK